MVEVMGHLFQRGGQQEEEGEEEEYTSWKRKAHLMWVKKGERRKG